jgi:hypothetical protein
VRVTLLCALAAALAACGPTSDEKASGATKSQRSARPGLEEAIDRGVAYLVGAQKKDGSWGSPAPTLTVDVYAPVPGAFPAMQVAASALAVSALVETGDGKPGVADAVRHGADFLLAHHQVKRVGPDNLYNVWTHAYAIEAFARLYDREQDLGRRAQFKKGMEDAAALLDRYESVDGGWGYYDDYMTKTPGHWTTSFTTATGLVALKMAKDRGAKIPERLIPRGIKVLEMCRFPNDAFAYAIDHYRRPQGRINHVQGSLARTPSCLLALDAWGEKVSPERAEKALLNLEKDGRFLQIARKYPVPHETWYQNSGYFCFYGYYYASLLVPFAPEANRDAHRASIAKYMTSVQEKDGSFWDYQLYGYHKAYGTGYALLTLAYCR